MASGRDDFVIAFRSAFLKKKDKQRFSLLTLIILSIIVIILGNQDFMDITYAKSFSSIPFITATSIEDINVFAENITSSGCTIRSSAKVVDGFIHVHIIGIK